MHRAVQNSQKTHRTHWRSLEFIRLITIHYKMLELTKPTRSHQNSLEFIGSCQASSTRDRCIKYSFELTRTHQKSLAFIRNQTLNKLNRTHLTSRENSVELNRTHQKPLELNCVHCISLGMTKTIMNSLIHISAEGGRRGPWAERGKEKYGAQDIDTISIAHSTVQTHT